MKMRISLDRGQGWIIVNRRDRFLQTAMFGEPDRIPLSVGGVRPLTRKAWIKQGLPEGQSVPDYLGFQDCTIGSVGIASYPGEGFDWKPGPSSINLGPTPPFEYKILRADERHRVWRDSLGIVQMGFQEDWMDGWSGFATRAFMDFPVKNMRDFLRMKKRYDPKDPKRYPENWDELAEAHQKRDHPLSVVIRGPFWWTRDMTGLRKIATGIYKEPELIRKIMDFCADFQTGVLDRALDTVDVDYVIVAEDMGYKNGPMIGPETMREFMGHAYRAITDFFRGHGVRTILVDSDGYVEPLVPVWLELGINGTTPCEVAAGMDVVKLGEEFPKLVIMGGIDKRKLARGKEAIREEVMYKVPPLVKRKGYFPGVDHAVPPDISLENFRYFVELLRQLCGW